MKVSLTPSIEKVGFLATLSINPDARIYPSKRVSKSVARKSLRVEVHKRERITIHVTTNHKLSAKETRAGL